MHAGRQAALARTTDQAALARTTDDGGRGMAPGVLSRQVSQLRPPALLPAAVLPGRRGSQSGLSELSRSHRRPRASSPGRPCGAGTCARHSRTLRWSYPNSSPTRYAMAPAWPRAKPCEAGSSSPSGTVQAISSAQLPTRAPSRRPCGRLTPALRQAAACMWSRRWRPPGAGPCSAPPEGGLCCPPHPAVMPGLFARILTGPDGPAPRPGTTWVG